MADAIWQTFLPKIRKTNHTSNLSQVSTTSFTGGRLSLSCRNPTQTSPRSQIGQGTSNTAVSSPRTPTSKLSSHKTTPKSSRSTKRTPKNKSPADGLSQKTIDSYFGNSFKKPETQKRINIETINLDSDSGEDEASYREHDRPSNHKPVKPSTVSRALFSSSSTLESCKKKGQVYNCEIEACIQDKENRNSSSLNTNTSKLTEENVNTSDMGVFKSPKAFKYKVSSITNSSVKINISSPTTLGNSTQGAAIYKDGPVASTKNQTNGERVGESMLVNVAGCGQNSVVKTVQPTRFPECDKLGSNLDGNSESLALADEKTQDWMSQETVSKWKSLMERMQRGENTLRTSQIVSSSSSSNSSVSNATSCDAQMGRNGWRSMGYNGQKNSRTCPFYKLIQGTKFAVDAFSYGTIQGVTHYFLSHFHYDHYMGLGKKFSHPIYCSSVTAQLVAMKIKIDPNLLNRLDPGHTVIIDNTKVTALDANHCPGSLMLLFELKDGRTHLHVGDFRAHPCMESYHAFWNVYIDQLYLDTTYCDPAYNFPSQQEVIGNVLSIVNEAVKKEPMTLIVCGTYTIGKERVFAAVAEKLKAKIWAPADKFKVLQCVKEGLEELSSSNTGEVEGGAGRELGLYQALGLLTKVKEDAQIHVLPMAKLKREYLEEHLYSIKEGKYTNVVAFHPTGWTHGRSKKGGSNLVYNSNVVKIYEVAYSEHSSFPELARFVKFIQPKQVIKTVNVGNLHQRKAMDKHINSWMAEVKSRTLFPNKYTNSPDPFQVTEEQKKPCVFQPKIGSKFFPTRTDFHFSETCEAEHSENTQYSLKATILSSQTSVNDIEESRTDSMNLMPGATLKRKHSFNSGQYHKKTS